MTDPFTEIERKYVVKAPQRENLIGYMARRYEQAYIVTGGAEVRIRRDDRPNSYRLAVKRGTGFVRDEVEVRVDEASGARLFDMGKHWSIEKTRYAIGGGGHYDWVLDEFHGRFEGLWLAEIELPNAETEVPLRKLPWFVRILFDVTEIPEYKCQNIAQCRDLRHLAEAVVFGINNERVISDDAAKARPQADGSYE